MYLFHFYVAFPILCFWRENPVSNLSPLRLNKDQLSDKKWEVKRGNSFGLDKQQMDYLMYLMGFSMGKRKTKKEKREEKRKQKSKHFERTGSPDCGSICPIFHWIPTYHSFQIAWKARRGSFLTFLTTLQAMLQLIAQYSKSDLWIWSDTPRHKHTPHTKQEIHWLLVCLHLLPSETSLT